MDTSDNKNKLSTLLLKQQNLSYDWERIIQELEIRLIKGSLTWPTKYIQKEFGRSNKRISHPKTASENKSLLDKNVILRWAERVFSEIPVIRS